MNEYNVKFTIHPNVLVEMLSSSARHINTDAGAGNVFVAVMETDSKLYEQQGCSNSSKYEEPEGPRIVIGMHGQGPTVRFIEGPLVSVEEEGMFLFREPERLSKWAKTLDEPATLTYGNKQGSNHWLHLDHEGGSDHLRIQQFYFGEDFERNFAGHQERFDSPEEPFVSEDAAGMFSLAANIAPKSTGGGRVGDLSFSRDGSELTAEFLTVQEFGKPIVASTQTVTFDSEAVEDVEWEVQKHHLTFLSVVAANETTTAAMDWIEEDSGEVTNLVQFDYAYSHHNDMYYVQTQYIIQRHHAPIRSHLPDAKILLSDKCKLYATCQTREFLQAFDRIWALRETKLVESSRDEEENLLYLQSDSKEHESHVKKIEASFGESEIERYLFMPYVQGMVEAFLDESLFLQIRSFPLNGEEAENVYILLPVPEGQSDPTKRVSAPDQHLVINWHSE